MSTVVSSDTLSPIPSISSAAKTPENTEEDPNDSEPADEGDIQME
jgi:NaMN:DMB phosphoribosyltransferase